MLVKNDNHSPVCCSDPVVYDDVIRTMCSSIVNSVHTVLFFLWYLDAINKAITRGVVVPKRSERRCGKYF